MQPTDTALLYARARRGFNLVEAAIVLGVVGLVIGGIWYAASSFRTEWFANKLWNDLLTAERLFSQTYDYRTAAYCGSSHDCYGSLPALFYSALDGKLDGYKPSAIIFGAGPSMKTPLENSNLFTTNFNDGLLSGPSPTVGLGLSRIPKNICLRIVAKARTLLTSLSGSQESLRAIIFHDGQTSVYQAWYTRPPYYGSLRFDTAACSSTLTTMQFIFSPRQ